MCGICGKISSKPIDERLIKAMNEALRHRGPDGEGSYFGSVNGRHVALGHRRLSIIDLSDRAKQPLANEDGSVHIVVNGEIYNHEALRERLGSLGHSFRSQSDSEVILHAYEQWGTDCLREIKGMFAFALWDGPRERLFMARDPFGEKPLFYNVKADQLVFASELPALLKEPFISPRLNETAVLEYLYYQVTFSPQTALAGINKLPPGHFATFQKGGFTLSDYVGSAIAPVNDVFFGDIETAARTLKTTFYRSTEPLMSSDVPVGVFLSGGIDSSLILAMAAKHCGEPIHTFSIGFDEAGFNELPWARKMARRFGARHHEEMVGYNIPEVLPELIRHLGEPMADASIIPYYHLSRLASSEVKVVLGGDGADELWGGYRRHWLRPWLGLFSRSAPLLTPILRRFSSSDRYYSKSLAESLRLVVELSNAQKAGYVPWNPLFDRDALRTLVGPNLFPYLNSFTLDLSGWGKKPGMPADSVNRMLRIDQGTFLPEDILAKADRMSMAHSLEVRSPFLYPDLAVLANDMPGRYKVGWGKGKRVLRQWAREVLPRDIVERRKHGFSVPVDAWFRKEGFDVFFEALPSGSLVKNGWIRGGYVSELLSEHVHRRANHGRRLWGLLVLQLWCDQTGL